jgi:hypothetical protein
VFKIHFGKLTLKIYTNGERVLRIEAIVQNTRALPGNRSWPHFPTIVALRRAMVERFLNALQALDVCFIADSTLEQLSLPSQWGKRAWEESTSTSFAGAARSRRCWLCPVPRGALPLRTGLARFVPSVAKTEEAYSSRRAA